MRPIFSCSSGEKAWLQQRLYEHFHPPTHLQVNNQEGSGTDILLDSNLRVVSDAPLDASIVSEGNTADATDDQLPNVENDLGESETAAVQINLVGKANGNVGSSNYQHVEFERNVDSNPGEDIPPNERVRTSQIGLVVAEMRAFRSEFGALKKKQADILREVAAVKVAASSGIYVPPPRRKMTRIA